ncbi:MAG: hypothetical protein WAM82_25395 [Thermoanaerobaculia bacterium]
MTSMNIAPLRAVRLSAVGLLLLLRPAPSPAGESQSGTRPPAVGMTVETERYRATLTTANQVQEPASKRLLWRYTFRAEDRASHAVHVLEYPDNYGSADNQLRWFGLGGDRLYAFRSLSLAIFALSTGELADDLAVAGPVASPRGDAVAYGVRQLKYAGSDRQGSIVGVLDLATGKHRYVFPEPGTIQEFRDGKSLVVMGPERDLDQQHSVDEIFWSPAGDRLAFLCAHGFSLHPPGQMYLVVVDLGGPSGSRFIHQALAPQLYRKVSGNGPAAAVYFQAASIIWLDARTLEVRPTAESSGKVRDRIVVKLSEVAQ